jgi:parallel beta-helix repeat protein
MRLVPLSALVLAILCLTGCPDTGKPDDTGGLDSNLVDLDGDGVTADEDCDDSDPDVYPGAEETCNALDDDCDGEIDEGAGELVYADADDDGWGNAEVTTNACSTGDGWVDTVGDCDDEDPDVHPDAEEICNGVDDDCDGDTDTGASDAPEWYADADGDGFGDPTEAVTACESPSDAVDPAVGEDCDDDDDTIHPDADEICNGVDDDCDGDIDEDAVDAPAWYADADGDGYGDPEVTSAACEAPSGTVDPALGEDCDDADAGIHPGAAEHCDGVDEDCDGDVDEDGEVVDGDTWYADSDGDGFGDAGSTLEACGLPSGYVADASDCVDTDASMYPGAIDVCDDKIDGNCDGEIDEGCDIEEHCGVIRADETWSADVEHLVTCTVSVYGTAYPVLTIEDGAVVYFQGGTALNVGTSTYGSLVVEGSTAGVLFTSDDASPAEADWDGVKFGSYDDGSWLEGVTLEYAGDNGKGGIYVYGASPAILDSVVRYNDHAGIYGSSSAFPTIEGSEISSNLGHGIELTSTSGLDGTAGPTFVDNVITGNSGYPMEIAAAYADQLDASSGFTGNGEDFVALLGDTIPWDGTWQNLGVPFLVQGDLNIEHSTDDPVLTIEDGVELQFQTGTDIEVGVGNPGSLWVQGTILGVTFTSDQASPSEGDWDGLYIGSDDGGSDLEGLTVSYGGDNGYGGIRLSGAAPALRSCIVSYSSESGLYASGGAEPAVSDSSFEHNADYGVEINSSSGLYTIGGPTFTGNTLTSNAGYPMILPANFAGQLDASSSFVGNGDDAVVLRSDDVTADATWQALDVPFLAEGDIEVEGPAAPELILEDGVVLLFEPSIAMEVGRNDTGTMVTNATSAGVLLSSSASSPAPGDWDGLYMGTHADGSALVGVTVEYAGANGYGGVRVYSHSSSYSGCTFQQNLEHGMSVSSAEPAITDSTFQDNEYDGLYIATSGGLSTTGSPSFTGNTATGNGRYPVQLPAASIGELDASSSFTGNTQDAIYVLGDTVEYTATWQALDVDYVVEDDIEIEGSSNPMITIEDGVTMRFETNAGLLVGDGDAASLQALGSSSVGITFTSASATPAAGDWDGVKLDSRCDAADVLMEWVTVEYGGDNGKGNLYIYGCDATIADSLMAYSSTWGIYVSSASPTITDVTYLGNTSGDRY